jgi:hypothetical protein
MRGSAKGSRALLVRALPRGGPVLRQDDQDRTAERLCTTVEPDGTSGNSLEPRPRSVQGINDRDAPPVHTSSRAQSVSWCFASRGGYVIFCFQNDAVCVNVLQVLVATLQIQRRGSRNHHIVASPHCRLSSRDLSERARYAV